MTRRRRPVSRRPRLGRRGYRFTKSRKLVFIVGAIVLFVAGALIDPELVRPSGPSAVSAKISGSAERVSDGDTLTIAGVRIRLCGIDAPEMSTPAGPASRAALQSLTIGRNIECTAVGDGTPCDGRSAPTSYDRVVAQCFAAGRDLAAEQVRAGQAVDLPRFSGGFYAP